jgi:hypothetical protein
MKKFAIIVGLLLVALSYAAPRTVLFEEFTRVSG